MSYEALVMHMAVPPSNQSVEYARAVRATSTATPTSVAAAPTSDDQRLVKALSICFLARIPLGNGHPMSSLPEGWTCSKSQFLLHCPYHSPLFPACWHPRSWEKSVNFDIKRIWLTFGERRICDRMENNRSFTFSSHGAFSYPDVHHFIVCLTFWP